LSTEGFIVTFNILSSRLNTSWGKTKICAGAKFSSFSTWLEHIGMLFLGHKLIDIFATIMGIIVLLTVFAKSALAFSQQTIRIL
jgi:hypothetical protein